MKIGNFLHNLKERWLVPVLLAFCVILSAVTLVTVGKYRDLMEKQTRMEQTWNELRDDMEKEAQSREQYIETLQAQLHELEDSAKEKNGREEERVRVTELPAGTLMDEELVAEYGPETYFFSEPIVPEDDVYHRINGKSYQENPYISLEQLRYLKMLHYNFDGKIQVGEMIVNQEIDETVLDIFYQLFLNEYQIQSMRLIDDYWDGDGNTADFASIEANNTSAFNFRTVTGGTSLSNHAYGKAIDINPQQNPYVTIASDGTPVWYHENAAAYVRRDTGLDHVITQDDLCYQLFLEYGFQWGGDWKNPKDYQHFEIK